MIPKFTELSSIKVMGADSSRNVGRSLFCRWNRRTIERYSHPATKGVDQGGKRYPMNLTPAELDIRMFANSRIGTMGKERIY